MNGSAYAASEGKVSESSHHSVRTHSVSRHVPSLRSAPSYFLPAIHKIPHQLTEFDSKLLNCITEDGNFKTQSEINSILQYHKSDLKIT